MRTKEAIFLIKDNPYAKALDKLFRTSKEEFYRRKLNSRILDPFWGDTTHMVFDFRVKNLLQKIPSFDKTYTFYMGAFEIKAHIYIEVDYHSRRKLDITHNVEFSGCEVFERIMYYEKVDNTIPLDVNLDNPIPFLKKRLRNHIYEKGYFNAIQYLYCWDKQTVKIFYKSKRTSYYSEANHYKWIKKHFNVISNVSLDDTIKWVNKYGKQSKPIILKVLNCSFMYDFDGSIDEAEEYFYEELSQYPKNTRFIN